MRKSIFQGSVSQGQRVPRREQWVRIPSGHMVQRWQLRPKVRANKQPGLTAFPDRNHDEQAIE